MAISPQGYKYNLDPASTHPFWDTEGQAIDTLTATASVDGTTGSPSVTVTKTASEDGGSNFDFKFTGLKGETGATGATGAQGEPGATGATGAQGEKGDTGAQGAPGVSPVVTSTGSTESGALAGTVTGADGTEISIYNGAQGEKGEKGETGATGATGAAGKDATIPDNLIAEINDSITENTTDGYDKHTLKETENGGTINDIGSFYIARKQITGASIADNVISMPYVSQDGTTGTDTITLPASGGSTLTAHSVSSLTYNDLIEKAGQIIYYKDGNNNHLITASLKDATTWTTVTGTSTDIGYGTITFNCNRVYGCSPIFINNSNAISFNIPLITNSIDLNSAGTLILYPLKMLLLVAKFSWSKTNTAASLSIDPYDGSSFVHSYDLTGTLWNTSTNTRVLAYNTANARINNFTDFNIFNLATLYY